MHILPVLLAASVAASPPALLDRPVALPVDTLRSDPVLVRTVIDGDTIDVAVYGRVRLLGIDAPEMGRGFDTAAPFGKEARDRLASLVLHRWVRLEQEAPLTDVYNRRLAYVMTETGQFVNAVLVREGLARVTARLPLTRLDELKRAEAEAQTFRRGMWGEAPDIPVAGYTRRSDGTKSGTTSAGTSRSKKPRTRQPAARRPAAKRKRSKKKT